MKEIDIVDNNVPYSKVIDFALYVVSKSFDDSKMFHAYLRDYYETICLLSMYTDYDDSYGFDDIMEIYNSESWAIILDKLGKKYQQFHYYIDSEIERINAPFADINSTISIAKETLIKVSALIDAVINNEEIKNIIGDIDVNRIYDILDTYNAMMETKNTIDEVNNEDTNQGSVIEFPQSTEN